LEQLLLRERVHGVPVVDADGRLVGVVSQTDLLTWHYTTGVDGATFYDAPDSTRVGEHAGGMTRPSDIRTARIDELMSPIVHCICPDQSLALAAARMLSRQVHRLIVLDEQGRVLGLISAVDLLRAVPGVEDALVAATEEKRLSDRLTAESTQ
jgi:CBS-domain-containing membrane protein